MSTAFDREMAAVATALLNEFGTTATLHSVVEGVYDPFGGASSPDQKTAVQVKASPPEDFLTARATGRSSPIASADVLETDLFTWLDTIDVDGASIPLPTAKRDTLTIAGRTFAIWGVEELRSGDDVAVYGLKLRVS